MASSQQPDAIEDYINDLKNDCVRQEIKQLYKDIFRDPDKSYVAFLNICLKVNTKRKKREPITANDKNSFFNVFLKDVDMSVTDDNKKKMLKNEILEDLLDIDEDTGLTNAEYIIQRYNEMILENSKRNRNRASTNTIK